MEEDRVTKKLAIIPYMEEDRVTKRTTYVDILYWQKLNSLNNIRFDKQAYRNTY